MSDTRLDLEYKTRQANEEFLHDKMTQIMLSREPHLQTRVSYNMIIRIQILEVKPSTRINKELNASSKKSQKLQSFHRIINTALMVFMMFYVSVISFVILDHPLNLICFIGSITSTGIVLFFRIKKYHRKQ